MLLYDSLYKCSLTDIYGIGAIIIICLQLGRCNININAEICGIIEQTWEACLDLKWHKTKNGGAVMITNCQTIVAYLRMLHKIYW